MKTGKNSPNRFYCTLLFFTKKLIDDGAAIQPPHTGVNRHLHLSGELKVTETHQGHPRWQTLHRGRRQLGLASHCHHHQHLVTTLVISSMDSSHQESFGFV